MREPYVPQLQKDEYLAWEARQRDRFELHHGFLVAFAGGTLDHDTLSFNLQVALKGGYPSPCRSFGPSVKVEIASDTFYYADAGVTCGSVEGQMTTVRDPIVVCEVLSESTRSYDVVEKRANYRRIDSLRAYVIVHTRSRRIERDSRQPDGSWQTEVIDSGEIALGVARVTLDGLYAETSVPRAF